MSFRTVRRSNYSLTNNICPALSFLSVRHQTPRRIAHHATVSHISFVVPQCIAYQQILPHGNLHINLKDPLSPVVMQEYLGSTMAPLAITSSSNSKHNNMTCIAYEEQPIVIFEPSANFGNNTNSTPVGSKHDSFVTSMLEMVVQFVCNMKHSGLKMAHQLFEVVWTVKAILLVIYATIIGLFSAFMVNPKRDQVSNNIKEAQVAASLWLMYNGMTTKVAVLMLYFCQDLKPAVIQNIMAPTSDFCLTKMDELGEVSHKIKSQVAASLLLMYNGMTTKVAMLKERMRTSCNHLGVKLWAAKKKLCMWFETALHHLIYAPYPKEMWTHCNHLGVKPWATKKEWARAYRKKARECHPDKSAESDAAEKFRALRNIYDWILQYNQYCDDLGVELNTTWNAVQMTYDNAFRKLLRESENPMTVNPDEHLVEAYFWLAREVFPQELEKCVP